MMVGVTKDSTEARRSVWYVYNLCACTCVCVQVDVHVLLWPTGHFSSIAVFLEVMGKRSSALKLAWGAEILFLTQFSTRNQSCQHNVEM